MINRFLALLLFGALGFEGFSSPKYEVRGVWVATVANIDWPSSKLLSVRQIKDEVNRVLDSCVLFNLNAVFVQVRPTADAFYFSKSEPWSQYLTGIEGKSPQPHFDPMKYWIEEAHARGIEFHAWLNPYRISMNLTDRLSPKNVAVRHPEWVVSYGGKRYLDPGEPGVMTYFCSVVEEIVARYEVDGIHLDDYFYPYPVKGEFFNDDRSYARYGHGFEYRDDWRRNNVDRLVELVHKSIKKLKPGVKFGISPFGIWRNGFVDSNGSDTEAGITNYDDLFADVLGWLKNGWLDYLAPQIYWNLDHPKASYSKLLEWWSLNRYNTPLLIGESLYKINSGDARWIVNDEMQRHLELSRQSTGVNGTIFFSFKHLRRNLFTFQDDLRASIYAHKAIPAYPMLQTPKNESVVVLKKKRGALIIKMPERGKSNGFPDRFVVYRFDQREKVSWPNGKNMVGIFYKSKIKLTPRTRKEIGQFVVTSLSPEGLESPISNVVEVKGY